MEEIWDELYTNWKDCPNCHKPCIAASFEFGWLDDLGPFKFCPYCGVELDGFQS